MATFFRNKVIKDVGKVPIEVFSVTPGSSITVVGISMTNLTDYPVRASILIQDDTSVEGYYIKDVAVNPNSSLRPIPPGEKLMLPSNNVLKVLSTEDDSIDCVVSFVEII
jgi:hypothetical protein